MAVTPPCESVARDLAVYSIYSIPVSQAVVQMYHHRKGKGILGDDGRTEVVLYYRGISLVGVEYLIAL